MGGTSLILSYWHKTITRFLHNLVHPYVESSYPDTLFMNLCTSSDMVKKWLRAFGKLVHDP